MLNLASDWNFFGYQPDNYIRFQDKKIMATDLIYCADCDENVQPDLHGKCEHCGSSAVSNPILHLEDRVKNDPDMIKHLKSLKKPEFPK